MINLPWEWIPLIITMILWFLSLIFERGQDWGVFMGLTGFCGIISAIIYFILGCKWLYNHINIT